MNHDRTDELDLTAEELRVLGCLLEKQATTPDNYPLSTNALIAACNQSTSRDPVVDYSERVIDATMLQLRDRGLARTVRGDGQRVHKHKHVVDEAWSVSGLPLALLSVLMLRGAQTVAELRTRTERYLPGGRADDRDIEDALRVLAEREPPFVELLVRRPGEREARWIHRLGEVAEIHESAAEAPRRAPVERGAPAGHDDERIQALSARVDDLTARLDALIDRFDALVAELGAG
jgi:uncharacterized protein YceH (UPF0502 family)